MIRRAIGIWKTKTPRGTFSVLLAFLCTILLFTFVPPSTAQVRKLVVISVDGLDQRYLANADQMKLRIPNIRRLISQGEWSAGVVGVVPTVTWPSHTTIISGVDPSVHGIRGNRRPRSEGGEYYWDASLLKARTLLDAMKDAGRSTAAITWPVTVNAPVTYNLPEYFMRRRGGDMDTRSIESKTTPKDLIEKIVERYPTFGQQWMEDRTRALAVQYILLTYQPDLLLAHFVDLDSESHDVGPFTREANATLEHIDELIGDVLKALPRGYSFALVSDHGFEAVKEDIHLDVVSKARGVEGVRGAGGIAIGETPAAAALLQQLKSEGRFGIGREIPKDELMRFSQDLAKFAAVFESSPGVMFTAGGDKNEERSKPVENGNHGHWPMRYRSVYIAWGSGVKAGRLPEISQKDIAGRLASLLGVSFTPGR